MKPFKLKLLARVRNEKVPRTRGGTLWGKMKKKIGHSLGFGEYFKYPFQSDFFLYMT